jgi:hypothetical protein
MTFVSSVDCLEFIFHELSHCFFIYYWIKIEVEKKQRKTESLKKYQHSKIDDVAGSVLESASYRPRHRFKQTSTHKHVNGEI